MLFYLTDNHEVYATQLLTQVELEQENQKAKDYTDGNLYWVEASPEMAEMPKSIIFKHYKSLRS